MEILLVNGQNALIEANHRALAYGDGLFETCLVSHRTIHFLAAHLQRLMDGANKLLLPFDDAQKLSLKQDVVHLTSHINEPHVLKIMLLRKAPGRGYDFNPKVQDLDVVIQLNPYQKPDWCQGAKVVESSIPVSENAYLAGIKHLNRLDSVLARQEARGEGAHDALMLTSKRRVIESSMANVFLKVQGQWFTPILDTAGVNGIIRQHLLSAFSSQILEQHIDQATLAQVESAFLTNSLMGIIPIIELNQRKLELCSNLTQFTDSLRLLCD
ncbi:aminodeoxychorismate lyase [Reinekea forsetii]|nr:aminodeoxychorismate lyase [Reinekea forsetii]